MSSVKITAIETIYRGNRFRSRTEAKWAVFLDLVGEPYDYEPQGMELPSGPYLPDFWLPRAGAWLEVKGAWDQVETYARFGELAAGTDRPVLVAAGQPKAGVDLMLFTETPAPFPDVDLRIAVDGARALYPVGLAISADGLRIKVPAPKFLAGDQGGNFVITAAGVKAGESWSCDKALREAGMARFEHGEAGARR